LGKVTIFSENQVKSGECGEFQEMHYGEEIGVQVDENPGSNAANFFLFHSSKRVA